MLRLYTVFPQKRDIPGPARKLPCDNFKTTTGPGTHARSVRDSRDLMLFGDRRMSLEML